MAAPLIGVTPMYAVCFFGYSVGLEAQVRLLPPEEKKEEAKAEQNNNNK